MAKARLSLLSLILLTLSLHVNTDSSPSQSPSLLPESPSPSPLSSPESPSPSPLSSPESPSPSPSSANTPSRYYPPSISPLASSPPAPPPSNPSPFSSTPAPSPEDSTLINHIGLDEKTDDDSSVEGMSGSKKAGIAIGIIVAASVLMLAGMVYKKRKQNLRRNQYIYGVRRDIM
ncbi:pectinesterase inhibitor 10-like [Vicia villosa]|uniref:pectinesterase inhibitor 10-like n=1 Tax=Vicia villosa TaxID=3911 RepID=UPI00273AB41B|nr:pectinesterase inhibitor 10-like [Vicia villosa]